MGDISVTVVPDAIVLSYRFRQYGEQWRDIRQRVPIVWTRCALGGSRPWFICAVYASRRYCGRRVAILYGAGDLFACRNCYRLAYASQLERARDRYLRQAQKIREQLGGSLSVFDSFPEKPPRMHWRTYERLRARGLTAEGRWNELLLDWLTRLNARRSRR